MLKIFTRINVLLVIGFLAVGSLFTSCDDEEDLSSEIKLNSFGPSPALRGGDIRFIGTNLDQVTSILLPGNVEISDFKEHSAGLIVLTVPEETIEGAVMLKTSQGDIVTKSPLGISEPIALTSISPAQARPGDVVTLTGTYLNLIEKVIFSSGQEVFAFESQSKTTLAVKVPEGAQTGIITLVAALEEDAPEGAEPIVIESEDELDVILPVIAGMSPATVKAGSSLTITGTDLGLVKQVSFTGVQGAVTEFEVNEAGDIVVTVPADAKDGKITVIPASSVAVESATDLVMMVPTITAVAPSPVKPGTDITVTGTNLDLVTSVMFGGEAEGTIVAEGRTAESFVVNVPKEATAGAVTFNTAAGKSVTSEDLAVINPAITGITPLEIKRNANITITGTNLDLVNKVSFVGGVDGVIVSEGRTAEKLEVTVPTGSESGKIKLTAVNGTETESTQELTILASNVPIVTSMPASAKAGTMITIEGEKLNLATEVIFPGGVKATTFGEKSATKLEVVVPADAEIGEGKITFVTTEGETTESPAFSVLGDIAYYIYQDALNAEWQKWNGWGTTEQEMASTEQVKAGATAIKVSYNDAYGALQLHPNSADVLTGYTHIMLSVYGATGDNRMALQVKTPGGTMSAEPTFTVKQGEYQVFEIPISELGDITGGVAEFMIKNYGTQPNTIYIDEFGLR